MVIYYLRYYIKDESGKAVDAGQLGSSIESSNDQEAIQELKKSAEEKFLSNNVIVQCSIWKEEGRDKEVIDTFIIEKPS